MHFFGKLNHFLNLKFLLILLFKYNYLVLINNRDLKNFEILVYFYKNLKVFCALLELESFNAFFLKLNHFLNLKFLLFLLFNYIY